MDNGKRTVSDLNKMSLKEFKLKLLLLGHTRILNTYNKYKWDLSDNRYLFISTSGRIGISNFGRLPEVVFRDFEEAIEYLVSNERKELDGS